MEKSVLLLMDLQERMMENVEGSATLLQHVRIALDGARKAGIPVIFVQLGFEEGYPEVGEKNKAFAGLKPSGFFLPSDTKRAIVKEIAPLPGETVICKKRYSAFAGSSLEVILRAMQADRLVMSGVSTSGIVLSTFLAAADMDFNMTVLQDCCLDRDPEMHQFLFEKIYSRRGLVQNAADWVKSL
ncbi:nicotinamidase-related amidase [Chitinophaga dinghuensis]|uniref:Nicotinamidase-related amidase n=1 Tax=Chitinophaga dinghuensis TaxID=1539050 RepID=A0A327WB62_9BACT|nr:isochorismatase family cysteine hydrolase [Chitinophaga dinghuensis]RAJ87987.1 nicotinamidase-related amidase [Chitinophaga dinghuensis]